MIGFDPPSPERKKNERPPGETPEPAPEIDEQLAREFLRVLREDADRAS